MLYGPIPDYKVFDFGADLKLTNLKFEYDPNKISQKKLEEMKKSIYLKAKDGKISIDDINFSAHSIRISAIDSTKPIDVKFTNCSGVDINGSDATDNISIFGCEYMDIDAKSNLAFIKSGSNTNDPIIKSMATYKDLYNNIDALLNGGNYIPEDTLDTKPEDEYIFVNNSSNIYIKQEKGECSLNIDKSSYINFDLGENDDITYITGTNAEDKGNVSTRMSGKIVSNITGNMGSGDDICSLGISASSQDKGKIENIKINGNSGVDYFRLKLLVPNEGKSKIKNIEIDGGVCINYTDKNYVDFIDHPAPKGTVITPDKNKKGHGLNILNVKLECIGGEGLTY